ncbi:unnamed protein product [Coccothraustes coccothraustes]
MSRGQTEEAGEQKPLGTSERKHGPGVANTDPEITIGGCFTNALSSGAESPFPACFLSNGDRPHGNCRGLPEFLDAFRHLGSTDGFSLRAVRHIPCRGTAGIPHRPSLSAQRLYAGSVPFDNGGVLQPSSVQENDGMPSASVNNATYFRQRHFSTTKMMTLLLQRYLWPLPVLHPPILICNN